MPMSQKKIERARKDWDEYFLEMAELVSSRSRDSHHPVGAVAVGEDNVVVATGYNGLPRRVADLDIRLTKEDGEKYKWIAHAETNTVCNAARVGVKIKGATLYVTTFPCSRCAGEIVQAGIRRVVTLCSEMWKNDTSKDDGRVSLRIMMEAGVEIHAPNINIGELDDKSLIGHATRSKSLVAHAARSKTSVKRRVARTTRAVKYKSRK